MSITLGARLHGTVRHVITRESSITACGRMVIPGKGIGSRMCLSCVRLNTEARKMNDTARKAERDARIQATMTLPTEEVMSWEWELSAEELEMTRAKIDKINTRCANKGIPGGLTLEVREVMRTKFNSILNMEIEYPVYMTTVTGIAPHIPGWSFIATLDYDVHAGLVVRGYPGAVNVDRAALKISGGDQKALCDHCQTTRYRTSTYIMRNDETGEQVQVGSACIKDFTGWNAMPYTFDRMAKDVGEFSEGFGGGPRDVTVLTALAVTWACVKEYGYKRSMEPGSTKGMALDVIDPPKPTKHNAMYLEDLKRLAKYSEEMYGRAQELKDFIMSDNFRGSDDFVLNMRSIVGAEKVSFKNFGILCYAPQAWALFLEKTLIRKIEKQASPSKHVGTLKERREFTLTVESVKECFTDFGASHLYRMLDAEGNVFKWFASKPVLTDHLSKTVTLVGTIIKHSDWKGVPETSINRCKVLSVQD